VNLTINAVQAMTQSGAARRNILIQTMLLDPETIGCIVEDSGPGINAAHMPRLFDSFFTTKDAGMGLGLSISQSIIEAHGGCVRANNDSTMGGARFSFTLPVISNQGCCIAPAARSITSSCAVATQVAADATKSGQRNDPGTRTSRPPPWANRDVE
jgi:hypothetical protein